ncbi:hypothetical protein GJ496_002446 [Pomphorhynchus laevis]|nr:hypothetical protein GJ496_002446 [Pomphorhynchus laevis]
MGNRTKNGKIETWFLELYLYNFDIIYHHGKQFVVSDTLSRVIAATGSSRTLMQLHANRYHPSENSIPDWLVNNKSVYVKQHDKVSKYSTTVIPANIYDVNSGYSIITYSDHRKNIVSNHNIQQPVWVNSKMVISLNAWNYLKFRALKQRFRSVLPGFRAGSDTNRLEGLRSDGEVIFQALRRTLMRSGLSRLKSQ